MKKLSLLIASIFVLLTFACTPPDATVSGIGDCNSLPVYTGSHLLDTNGITIDGVRILGGLDIVADNVTVSNSCILGNGSAIIYVRPQAANTFFNKDVIRRQHSPTADNTCPFPVDTNDDNCKADMGIYYMSGATGLLVTNTDISDVVQGINDASDNMILAGSYLHDFALTNPGDHIDGFICNGNCHNIIIQGNSIEVPETQTSPIALYEDGYRCGPNVTYCPSDHITVKQNLLNGGGFCIYPAWKGTYIDVELNTFGNKYYVSCGFVGLHSQFGISNEGNVWAGNVRSDDTIVDP